MKKTVADFPHNEFHQGTTACGPQHIQVTVVGDGTVEQCGNCKAQRPFSGESQAPPSVFPPATGSFERPQFTMEEMFGPSLA
ncbi:MAG: hypothetical protein HY974_02240 [Candidatus Kerfeldbacteria bacterium]|nr:hypothetical protein [Candidatus Kerfeldbacteria bacterium]